MLKVHVVFEHGSDLRPYGCSYIRLLLPLGHPNNKQKILLTQGPDYNGEPADIVIVDRLWKPESVKLSDVEDLVNRVHASRSRLIYSLDDNLLDLRPTTFTNSVNEEHKRIVRYLTRSAHGVLVSTHALKKRLAHLNQHIIAIPNAIDERLFLSKLPRPNNNPLILGFMGTFSHDSDLMMILQALRTVMRRYPSQVELQLVGGFQDVAILQNLVDFPVKVLNTNRPYEYPAFVRWMTENLNWDIALAPLEDTAFTRCKSDIKFLDYSALSFPGIYSHMPVYASTINHLENGYLTENTTGQWIEALERLITDAPLRQKLAQNANDTVKKSRFLMHCAYKWAQALEFFVETASGLPEAPLLKTVTGPPSLILSTLQSSSMFSSSTDVATNQANPTYLNRDQKILAKIDKNGYGLEIGPSYSPVASKKNGYKVHVIDHASREELVKKYSALNMPVENIEEVDFVWHGESYVELTNRRSFYDWIIASHVIEHTPDFLGFLENCGDVLKDKGVLSLVIPDMRFCFDCFRPVTSIARVVDAHIQKRTLHTPGTACEHVLSVAYKDGKGCWNTTQPGNYTLIHPDNDVIRFFYQALQQTEYLDFHAWCFTPTSFRLIMYDLYMLGLTTFREIDFYPTSGCEFYITLSRQGSPPKFNRLHMLRQIQKELSEAYGLGA